MVVDEGRAEIYGKKRPRLESVHTEPNSPEPKRVQREPDDSVPSLDESKGFKDVMTELGVTFPGPDQIREELLGILSDSDEFTDGDSAIQDLDLVIKSLQDELNQPPEMDQDELNPLPETEVSPTSQPDLGYLLEASDDELGLPPVTASPAAMAEEAQNTVSGAGEVEVPVIPSENVNFGKMFEFEDEFPSYEFGGIVEEEFPSSDFVLDGLFSYSEPEPSDQSELAWQRRLAVDPTALTG